MTQPTRRYLAVLGASALGSFAMVIFLLPPGETLSNTALRITVFFAGTAVAGYIYAQWDSAPAPERDEDLHAAVEHYSLAQNETTVPAALLDGASPLVALAREGEVLHPEFNDLLAPYFADTTLAFVQTAVHYEGAGKVAAAFYAQEMLGYSYSSGKNSLNAAVLRGSGAIIARDALREAYRPGISFGELGLRLQALGYTSHFEETPLLLAAAPQNLNQYWPLMLRRARNAFALLFPAITARHLPLAARLQYLCDAVLYAGLAAGALAAALAPLALIMRGTGPLIVSNLALPGLAFTGVCALLSFYALRRSAATPVMTPLLLTFAGAYAAAYIALRAGALRASTGYKKLVAIVRGDGSAGTAPAGTPARL